MNKYEVFKHFMEPLNREADIYVYLPQSYKKETTRSYPVLYMHDGQNLFDDHTASYGKSWGIVDAYESDPTLPEVIIVGINCAEGLGRLDEYSPWTNTTIKDLYDWIERDPGGLGDVYLDYLVSDIKPMIESKYRCLTDVDNTLLAGSSMGGLISTYAAAKYNNVFSRFGCFSNAYHFGLEPLVDYLKNADLTHVKKFYMDIGTEETSGTNEDNQYYISANKEVYELLKTKLTDDVLQFKIIEGAKHNEAAWEKRFPEVIQFLMRK